MKKVIYWASLLLFGGALIVGALKLGDTGLSATAYWFLFLGIAIYVNGMGAKFLHMSVFKLRWADTEEPYTPDNWRNEDIGMANFLPVFMEAQYTKWGKWIIEEALWQYKEEEQAPPASYKIGNFLLKSGLFQISGIVMIAFVIASSYMIKDYELYLGLTSEMFKMSLSGILALIFVAMLTTVNFSIYTIIEDSSNLVQRKWKRWVMISMLVFTFYVLAMLIVTLILGVTGWELPILGFIFNLNMVNIFIVLIPTLSTVQAFIMRGILSKYQYEVNRYLV